MENTEFLINFADKTADITCKIYSKFEVNEDKLESNNEIDAITENLQAQSTIIKPINGDTVHRICSGQVVLNLAIAVKELVENAIDAGATNIEIKLKEHGSELIEVIDNGCGVLQKNFTALTLKHYTSKIREFSDLESVETLGFRGEALSSLCALSNVSIITRHNSVNVGTKLEYDHNGKIAKQSSIARSEGTTVTLSNIFSTLPVRRKEFMKNVKREFNKMCQLLYAYCLVSVNIKITCTNQNGKGGKSVIIATQALPTIRENIISVFGAKQISSLIDISLVKPTEPILEEYGLKMTLKEEIPFAFECFISSVMHGNGRSTSDRQFYYINSRPCEPTKVMKLVNEIYRQFNANQYPFVYLNILMERKHVDVNVTPDKRQIFLDKEKLLLAVLKSSLLDAFKNFPSTFKMQNLDITKRKETQTTLNETLKGLKRTYNDALTPPSQGSLLERFQKKIKKNESVKEDLSKLVIEKSPLKKGLNDKMKIGLDSKEFDGLNNKSGNIEVINGGKQVESLVDCKYIGDGDEMVIDTKLTSKVLDIISHDAKMGQNIAEISSDMKLKNQDKGNEILTLNELDMVSIKVPENVQNITNPSPREIRICKTDDKTISSNKNEKITILNTTFESIEENIKKKIQNELNDGRKNETFVKFRSKIAPNCNKEAERELQKQITKDKFKDMEIVGQFNLGFIIGKLENDLFIVDQHATDEKYNYEQLQMNTVLETQILVNPKSLQLTAANESLLIESLEIFRKNGFQFDIDHKAEATKKIKLTAIPVSKNYSFGKDDIDELLFMLQDGNNKMCRPSRVGQMFASRACRKSVMIGKSLTETDMRRLIDHMGEIEQPWNCPHGRPTMRHLINLNLIQEQ